MNVEFFSHPILAAAASDQNVAARALGPFPPPTGAPAQWTQGEEDRRAPYEERDALRRDTEVSKFEEVFRGINLEKN